MSALIMFIVALLLLFLGIPVAFVFGAVALFFALFSPELSIEIFNVLPFRIYGIMSNQTLMAVPLFITMGLILEKSDMAKNLLLSMTALFSSIRGGLGVSVVLVGAIMAASTGIVSASVVMMSLIALPLMIRAGYAKSLSSGIVASSGTLGQIIPPSIILIILGDVMSVSVGDLFLGALLPGLLLVSLYIIYILSYAAINPAVAPALKNSNPASLLRVLKDLLAPLVLMISVLGSIFTGIASPTESAAFGALAAAMLAVASKSVQWSDFQTIFSESLKLNGMIFMILFGATAFSLVFNELGGTDFVLEFFSHDIADVWIFILFAMLAIFILGFFIDFIEISFIIVPILVPIVEAFGIDPIWFAVLIALNLQTSFLTPPFGLSLFFLKGSTTLVNTLQIYKGVIPFILLQFVAMALVILYPDIVFAYI